MSIVNIKGVKPGIIVFDRKSGFFDFEGFGHGSTEISNDNPHDATRGVEIRTSDNYVRNGVNNYFPFELTRNVSRSMLQKRAFKTISSVAAGHVVFVNEDGTSVEPSRQAELLQFYKTIGLTHNNFIKPVTQSNYLFGGTPVTVTFNSDGRQFVVASVKGRDYKTFRLDIPSYSEGEVRHVRHYYHRNWGYRQERRNRTVRFSERSVLSWLNWNEEAETNFEKAKDEVLYFPAWNDRLSLSDEVNRTQSFFIKDSDQLTDFYPRPVWFSGTSYNYIRGEFELSSFDYDEIKNGLHASFMVKVSHKAYKNPESGEAKEKFREHVNYVNDMLLKSYNSGAVPVIPVSPDGSTTNDSIEIVAIPTNNNKDRHTILNDRIKENILSANGAIYSELFGVRDKQNTFSEGDGKIIQGLKLLNKFTIKPLKKLLDDRDDGFLNILNDRIGIRERAVIVPNLSEFLSISPELSKHFLHPDQWFEMFADFGLSRPTIEQIESGLIPAYREINQRNTQF